MSKDADIRDGSGGWAETPEVLTQKHSIPQTGCPGCRSVETPGAPYEVVCDSEQTKAGAIGRRRLSAVVMGGRAGLNRCSDRRRPHEVGGCGSRG